MTRHLPIPITLTSRGVATATLRRLAATDASGLLTLEQAMVEDGQGMVQAPTDIPSNEAAMLRSLRPFLDGSLSGSNGIYLVVASRSAGTVPILGQGEVRRLAPTRVRHGAMLAVGVHPSARRRGYGRALMSGLLGWADGQGILRIELSVRADNAPARALYQRLGFVEEGRRQGFVRLENGHFVDDLIMARCTHTREPMDAQCGG